MSGNAWGICDRCGWRCRDRDLKSEWTGLRVCPRDFDPRPSWLDPPFINPLESTTVPNARLDQDAENPNFIDTDNPVSGDDL